MSQTTTAAPATVSSIDALIQTAITNAVNAAVAQAMQTLHAAAADPGTLLTALPAAGPLAGGDMLPIDQAAPGSPALAKTTIAALRALWRTDMHAMAQAAADSLSNVGS